MARRSHTLERVRAPLEAETAMKLGGGIASSDKAAVASTEESILESSASASEKRVWLKSSKRTIRKKSIEMAEKLGGERSQSRSRQTPSETASEAEAVETLSRTPTMPALGVVLAATPKAASKKKERKAAALLV